MRKTPSLHASLLVMAIACASSLAQLRASEEVLPTLSQRFVSPEATETPDFQRHVSPLLGRLGCNGRACHGSFQGRGGFQLSLFGYDFKMDHAALLDPKSTRVDLKSPLESLILNKPTDADEHEGGKRYEKGSWQHHVLKNWVLGGAKFDPAKVQTLARLEVQPAELLFGQENEKIKLRAVAVWQDGTREDVTPLCRFQSNDDLVAKIDQDGNVVAGQPGDTHLVVFYDNAVAPIPAMRPVAGHGKEYPPVPAPTEIDKYVLQKLKKLGLVPSELCSDDEFLRRVSLDLTGTLPSADEVVKFLADKSPSKRKDKINELLETPAYAAWWTTRLCDYTGNNADKLRNATAVRGRASQDWYQWIFKRVAENTPYDEIAEGIVVAQSRRPGQSYREYAEEMSDLYRQDSAESFADRPMLPHYWARLDFLTAEERAIGFAYTFLGIRIQCAQCHKHPFDQWSKEDFAQFKEFFGVVSRGNTQNRDPETKQQYEALVKELGLKDKRGNELRKELPQLLKDGKTVPFPEVHVLRVSAGGGGKKGKNQRNASPKAVAKILGDEVVPLADYEDPRTRLMDWLRQADNPYFARAFVNRVWANYFNVGIVEPPDDLSLANAPSNKPLLDYLSAEFVAHDYDMKWLHREIANSHAYQRSWRPNDTNLQDRRNFSRCIPRRLPAEVAYDAIQTATQSDARAGQARQQLEGRAIAMAEVGARNNARNGAAFALQVFGQSRRDSNCDCDRSSDPTLLQAVYLQNDREMYAMLNQRKTGWLDQLASQLGVSLGSAPSPQRPPNYEKQLANLRKRLAALKKSGDEKNARLIRQRIKGYVQRFGDPSQAEETPGKRSDKVAASDKAGASDKKAAAADVKQWVESAYLRTLSRYPRESELETSIAFIDGSEKKIDALRDLLWALLNTKEFVVNH